MSHATDRRMRGFPHRSPSIRTDTGLAQGTIVYTLDGALPVEYLNPGDRIITRAGARALRAVQVRQDSVGSRYALEFDAPQVIYADGEQVRTGVPA